MVKGVRIWYSKEIEIHSGIRPAVTFRENWWVDHRGGLCKSRHYLGRHLQGSQAAVQRNSALGWVCFDQVFYLMILVKD